MIIRKHFLIPLFLLCFAFANSQSYASEKAVFSLTPEEKGWLAEHPEISIGIMDAWAPMNFMDESGTPNGIGVDYLKALNQRLGRVLTLASITQEEVRRIHRKWLEVFESAKAVIVLTPEERAWLEAHPLIRVAAVTLDKEQSAGLAGVMGTHKTAS